MNTTTRKNTIKCTFQREHQKPLAAEIHDWIKSTLKVNETDIDAIQLDGAKASVFIKFTDNVKYESFIKSHLGEQRFEHRDGTVSTVNIAEAELGYKIIRVLNLPLEVTNQTITSHLSKYGKVINIADDYWSGSYAYKVKNGIRIVKIELTKHVPSYIIIENTKALTLYEGQPKTCSNCHSADHFRADCRNQRPFQYNAANFPDRRPNLYAKTVLPLKPTANRDPLTMTSTMLPQEEGSKQSIAPNYSQSDVIDKTHTQTDTGLFKEPNTPKSQQVDIMSLDDSESLLDSDLSTDDSQTITQQQGAIKRTKSGNTRGRRKKVISHTQLDGEPKENNSIESAMNHGHPKTKGKLNNQVMSDKKRTNPSSAHISTSLAWAEETTMDQHIEQ